SLAALLNQTSVIFALVLASVFLKERFTRRKLLAIVLGLAGVVLVVTAPF
ncbi:MAG: EamA family transporter, partial [Planctomycetes bacterium]|nr:EamA family transporter [Planctomycetota bacterium]